MKENVLNVYQQTFTSDSFPFQKEIRNAKLQMKRGPIFHAYI